MDTTNQSSRKEENLDTLENMELNQSLSNNPETTFTSLSNNQDHTTNSPIIKSLPDLQEQICLSDRPEIVDPFLQPSTEDILTQSVNEAIALETSSHSVLLADNTDEVIGNTQQNINLEQNSVNELTNLSKIKRPQLAMPQLYVRTDSLPPSRGFLPTDDLQIELIVPEKEPSSARLWFSEARSLVRDFLFAAATALLIVIFVVQPVKVEGTSMLPRLHDGERIFINKFIYQVESIKRGDIVVFWYPKNPSQSFIKRVIGVPGDEIRITNGKLYINNQYVPEPYLSPEYTANVMPNRYWIVEEHHYFVMGDNRDASNDSRAWGLVPEKYIYGKAIFRYWPLNTVGSLGD
jgi:signal peptidase I